MSLTLKVDFMSVKSSQSCTEPSKHASCLGLDFYCTWRIWTSCQITYRLFIKAVPLLKNQNVMFSTAEHRLSLRSLSSSRLTDRKGLKETRKHSRDSATFLPTSGHSASFTVRTCQKTPLIHLLPTHLHTLLLLNQSPPSVCPSGGRTAVLSPSH